MPSMGQKTKKMKKITIILALILSSLFINAQSLDEIIQKHIENSGGKERWENYKSQKAYGELHNSDGVCNIEMYFTKNFSYGFKEVDGKMRLEFGFDGNDYWQFDYKKGKLAKTSKETSARAKISSKHIGPDLVNYKEKGYEVTLLEDDFIQDEECFVLEINRGKKPKFGKMVEDIAIVYLSKETYLTIAEEIDYIRGAFETIFYIYHDDYREVDGLMLPFKSTYILNEYIYKIFVKKYELNKKVDPASVKFEE